MVVRASNALAVAGPTVALPLKLEALAVVTANSALILPANAIIQQILIQNTTANAITGGLKFGSTAGATDIVAALAVGANGLVTVASAALLKSFFSTSATQQIFIDAVVSWASASVNITIVYLQL